MRARTPKKRLLAWLPATMLALAVPAIAQLPLPRAQLPDLQVPGVEVPDLRGATGELRDTLHELAGTRALRVQQLARQHRGELERIDDQLVVRAEVVGLDMTQAALDRALTEKFLIKRRQSLPELGVDITVLQTPEGWSARRGLRRLRKLDPAGSYDFNHVYLDGGATSLVRIVPANSRPAAADGPRRIGLIDGGIDSAHETFNGRRIERYGCEGKPVPSTHGTAVAAILLSRQPIHALYAADVYCGLPTGGAADTIAAAFAWLARERVAVINVSLVGARNALLERVVQSLVARGFLIVAAVGNDGPAAPPLYPASYHGVIGVTAVDRHHRVLIEACRGMQVDFAARGADVESATVAPATYAAVRGTSFAAPVIAALLAELQTPDPALSQEVLARWTSNARDLGKQGRDDVYGAGELGGDAVALAQPQAADK
jgi:hypothetical protein